VASPRDSLVQAALGVEPRAKESQSSKILGSALPAALPARATRPLPRTVGLTRQSIHPHVNEVGGGAMQSGSLALGRPAYSVKAGARAALWNDKAP
jgi:hypothetical protein